MLYVMLNKGDSRVKYCSESSRLGKSIVSVQEIHEDFEGEAEQVVAVCDGLVEGVLATM